MPTTNINSLNLGPRIWSMKSSDLFKMRVTTGTFYKATVTAGSTTVTLTTGDTSRIVAGMRLVKNNGFGTFGTAAKPSDVYADVVSVQSSTQLTVNAPHLASGSITFFASRELTPSDFSILPPLLTATTIFVAAQGLGQYSSLSVILGMETVGRRIKFIAQVDNAPGSTWGLDSLTWPNFNIYPYGLAANMVGYVGDFCGTIIKKPHEIANRTLSLPVDLYSLPVAALYDTATKTVVATRLDAPINQFINLRFVGDTDSVKIQWEHLFYRPTQIVVQTRAIAAVIFEGWDSKALDAYDVHADIAMWYRDWMANVPGLEFTAAGPWRSRTSLNPAVKNMVSCFVAGPPNRTEPGFNEVATDIVNLQNILGISGTNNTLLVHLYTWATTAFNTRMPDNTWDNRLSNSPGTLATTLTAEVTTGLTTIGNLANVHLMPYTWENTWDINNKVSVGYTGKYNFENYPLSPTVSVNPSSYMLRDIASEVAFSEIGPFTIPLTYVAYGAALNFTYPQYSTQGQAVKDIIVSHYIDWVNLFPVNSRPEGWYYDVSPMGPMNREGFDANYQWFIASHVAGIRNIISSTKEAIRTQFNMPNVFFACEGFSDRFIGTFDIMHNIENGAFPGPNANRLYGGSVFSGQLIFGEYVRIGNHTTPNIYQASGSTPPTPAQIASGTIALMIWKWLLTGFTQVVSRVESGPLIPVTPSTGANDMIWKWMAALANDTVVSVLEKFTQGRLLPFPGGTINQWLRAFQQNYDLDILFWTGLMPPDYPTMAVCKQAEDGSVAIIAANVTHPSLDYSLRAYYNLPPANINYAATYTIQLDSAFHRLPSGKKNLYRYDPVQGEYIFIQEFSSKVLISGVQPPIYSPGQFPISLYVVTPAGQQP